MIALYSYIRASRHLPHCVQQVARAVRGPDQAVHGRQHPGNTERGRASEPGRQVLLSRWSWMRSGVEMFGMIGWLIWILYIVHSCFSVVMTLLPLTMTVIYLKSFIKRKEKVCKGHGPSARTDDSSLSPKTNSARPAGCGIASLASQGRIIPNGAMTLRHGLFRVTKFSGGDGLEPAHKRGNPLMP